MNSDRSGNRSKSVWLCCACNRRAKTLLDMKKACRSMSVWVEESSIILKDGKPIEARASDEIPILPL